MADKSNDGIKIISLAGNADASGTAGAPDAGKPVGTISLADDPPGAGIKSFSLGGADNSPSATASASSSPANSATSPLSAASSGSAANSPTSTTSPAAAPKSGGPSDMGGFFNRQAVKTLDSKLLESVVAQKGLADKSKPILGSAPALQKALEQEKEMQLKRRLRVAQVFFLSVFICALAMVLYFYSELSPGFNLFGANTTARLAQLNTNLASKQNELNRDRYLAAQLELNQLSFVSDQYFDATTKMAAPGASADEKQLYELAATESAAKIPVIIGRLRNVLQEDLVAKTFRSEAEEELTDDVKQTNALEALRGILTEYKNSLVATGGATDANKQEIRLTDNAIKLVGNTAVLVKVKSLSTDELKKNLEDYIADLDPLKRQSLQDTISSILSSTTSDIATITSIKNQRVDWLKVISQIEAETVKVDRFYKPADINRKSVISLQGGVEYTGYNFNTMEKSISIIGSYKTPDASTFSRVSELIDVFEKSPYFKNVEMRSFSKSAGYAAETGYEASFTLKLELETDLQAASEASKISLVKRIMAEKALRKRLNNNN